MAVVSRPIKHSRRATLLRGARQVLASWWLSVLAYVLLLVLGYLLLTPAFTWSQRQLDDIRYGFPRTTQFTAFVGHNEHNGDPTQFIALNLNGQISILELPGGDTTQTRALEGPYLVGADGPYAVPHLAIRDVNGDGATDLLLQIRQEVIVYINEDGHFRLMTPFERSQLSSPESWAFDE